MCCSLIYFVKPNRGGEKNINYTEPKMAAVDRLRWMGLEINYLLFKSQPQLSPACLSFFLFSIIFLFSAPVVLIYTFFLIQLHGPRPSLSLAFPAPHFLDSFISPITLFLLFPSPHLPLPHCCMLTSQLTLSSYHLSQVRKIALTLTHKV